jgi:hypothetical protein
MMPSAAAVNDNYLHYANAVVRVQMPDYFYAAWVSSRLVPPLKNKKMFQSKFIVSRNVY